MFSCDGLVAVVMATCVVVVVVVFRFLKCCLSIKWTVRMDKPWSAWRSVRSLHWSRRLISTMRVGSFKWPSRGACRLAWWAHCLLTSLLALSSTLFSFYFVYLFRCRWDSLSKGRMTRQQTWRLKVCAEVLAQCLQSTFVHNSNMFTMQGILWAGLSMCLLALLKENWLLLVLKNRFL